MCIYRMMHEGLSAVMTQFALLGSHFTRLCGPEYSNIRAVFCFIFLTLMMSRVSPVLANSVIEGFLQQAQQLKLAEQPAWLALLHYQKEIIGHRYISQADDERFFLSPEGRQNPTAELEADLRAMLPESVSSHAQCRFPARWYWLKQQLALPARYDVVCPELEKWLEQMQADSISLVFPSMYLNNPASSFGHTFLRFDNASSILLSHAINYAAANDPDDNPLAYVYNGVFGGYTGVFATRRYFEMVQDYSDIENRDIWEYRLSYTPQQITQLARHIWELKDIDFDYFFFRENCSYRLMAILDVVTEDAPLSTQQNFPLYAMPVDTVRTLGTHGLITERFYRPSLATRLKQGMAQFDEPARQAVMLLVNSALDIDEVITTITDEADQVSVLQHAYNMLQFRGQDNSTRAAQILSRRSQLDVMRVLTVQPTVAPEQGHDSARLSLAAGRQNSLNFAQLGLRPAFHDQLDAVDGYTRGSMISVLDTQLRWFPDSDDIRLEKLVFAKVESLTAVSEWYAPLSWQADIKLERQPFSETDSGLVFISRGGVGYAAEIGHSLLSVQAIFEADIADELHQGYSLLAGLQTGVLIQRKSFQLKLGYSFDEAVAGHEMQRYTSEAGFQFNLASNLALRLEYRLQRYRGFRNQHSVLSLQKYF